MMLALISNVFRQAFVNICANRGGGELKTTFGRGGVIHDDKVKFGLTI